MSKTITITTDLPPLPEGYGPEIYYGPQEDRPHVYIGGCDEDWCFANAGTTVRFPHAYKREPVKRFVYVNVYPGLSTSLHKSRKEADEWAYPHRLARIRVEFEEGRWDD